MCNLVLQCMKNKTIDMTSLHNEYSGNLERDEAFSCRMLIKPDLLELSKLTWISNVESTHRVLCIN